MASDGLLSANPQNRPRYALCTVLYNLDHDNRCGGDLRSASGRACSASDGPEDRERSGLSHSTTAIRLGRPASRAGTAGPVSRVLHRTDVDLGEFCLLRLFDVYQW